MKWLARSLFSDKDFEVRNSIGIGSIFCQKVPSQATHSFTEKPLGRDIRTNIRLVLKATVKTVSSISREQLIHIHALLQFQEKDSPKVRLPTLAPQIYPMSNLGASDS